MHEVLVNCLVSLIDRDFGYYFVILLPILNLSIVDGHISVSSVCQRSGKLFMIIIYYGKCSKISSSSCLKNSADSDQTASEEAV